MKYLSDSQLIKLLNKNYAHDNLNVLRKKITIIALKINITRMTSSLLRILFLVLIL